jgi:hypothetical protein
MNSLQQTKIVVAIPPAAIKDNADFTSYVIDLADFDGCDYLEFQISLGATDVALATLKVMESSVKTNATTLGGTPALVVDATTKPGATADNQPAVFGIDLRKTRQRYLQLQATAGNGTAGTYLSANAVGHRPNVASSNATERGLLFAQYA